MNQRKGKIDYLWLFAPLRFRFFIFLIFISIFGLAFTLSYQRHGHAIHRTIEENKGTARLLATIIQEHQKAAIGTIQSHAARPSLINAVKKKDSNEMTTHLSSLKADNSEIDMAIITDRAGTLWANWPVFEESHGRDFSHRDWYKGVSRDWKPYVSTVYRQVIGEKDISVMACAPISDETGRAIGILGTTQRTVFLGKIIQDIGFAPNTLITLVDQEGHVVYSNQFPYEKEIRGYPFFTALTRNPAPEGKGSIEIRDSSKGDRIRFAVYAPIKEIGWSVIVEKGNREILESETGFFAGTAAISILLFLFIASSLFYLRKGTRRRMLEEQRITKLNAELEQCVIERTGQLEAANKELEAFAYSVSHDLRAPLRAIDGFSRIVCEDYSEKLDAEGNRLLSVIRTNTKKMDQLITDLLALSRVSRSELLFSRIDMGTMVHSMFHEIVSLEIQNQFAFSVSPLPDAYGDPALMRQVWSNLLSNAVKYTLPKQERKIEVGALSENGFNTYYVKDSGVGFNPDYVHKLFGVFQRLHKTEEFEGTGVGLAIVQRIIHRHGGRAWADGKVNTGATFYFSLPTKETWHG
jgi:signal transduction histidine kinase